MSPHRERSGFTLIELLIVMAILAVATSLGTTAFVQMTGHWNALKTRTELDHIADDVFSKFLRPDFASALTPALSGVSLTGRSGSATDERFYGITLAADTFTLPIEATRIEGGKGPILVRYAVVREDDGGYALQRSVQDLHAKTPPSSTRIARGIVQMRVEYADGAGWKNEWTAPELPRAVRVSLTVARNDNIQREQIARQAVFRIHVQ